MPLILLCFPANWCQPLQLLKGQSFNYSRENQLNQAQLYMPVILAFGEQKQEDQKFKANLNCMIPSSPPSNRENQLFLAEGCFMNSHSFVSPSKETNQIHTGSVNYDDSCLKIIFCSETKTVSILLYQVQSSQEHSASYWGRGFVCGFVGDYFETLADSKPASNFMI